MVRDAGAVQAAKRFLIRTYGCQMNVHDTEKVANLLHHCGYAAARAPEDADLLIINTCSIRQKAEHRLYSDLGLLAAWKAERPGRILGVAGCVAQQEGDQILRRFPQVDFAFGTHSLRLVPALVESAARGRRELRIGETASPERFELPGRHPEYASETPGRAYVTVMEGCDMFCSFCVVPHTRGREISRAARAIVEEVESLVEGGVREIALLGQTVNAYGRHARGRGRSEAVGTLSFAQLLRRLDAVPGLERIRYTSPHPAFFDDELIRAHGELAALCPHVHLPVQSGSDAVLARMRRRHSAAAYRALVDRLRRARPDLALTTDLIVGFPGESHADFEATLELVREVGFVDAYSFKYSPRPNTPAAHFEDAVSDGLAQERLEALQALQRSLTLAYHRERVGGLTAVLVEGSSRHGGDQLAGRDPYHRVVNLAAPADGAAPPGSLATVRVVEATPHSLIGELASAKSAQSEPQRLKNGPGSADELRRSAVSGA
jgi:tRNA-2-methylthio-N6-dimethylallyladenosine synthase